MLPFTPSPAWPSDIVSSEVPEPSLEFPALLQSPLLRSFRNMMKALPLPSPKVMLSLRYNRYNMGNSDSLADPVELRFLIATSCRFTQHRQGSPAFIIIWLLLRATPVTPGAYLSVTVVIVRIDASVFPRSGKGRQLHCAFRGYIYVHLRCGPQICSTPFRSLCQKTWCSRLPFTPPSSYVGELPFRGHMSSKKDLL